jgi:hypothetical protein
MSEVRAVAPHEWKRGPINPPLLHHATFMTLDVDAMVAFYELVCGLHPVFYGHDAAWLTNDAANHRIALLTTRPSSTGRSPSGSTTTSGWPSRGCCRTSRSTTA